MSYTIHPYNIIPNTIFSNIANAPNMQALHEMETINYAKETSKKFIKNLEEELILNELNNKLQYLSNFPALPLEINKPLTQIDFNKLDPEVSDACFSIAEMLNWNKEAVLFAILGYINSATRCRYKIHVNNQWIEKSSLYIMLVGGPGMIKSGMNEMLITPFDEIQKEINSKYEVENQKTKYTKNINEKTKKIITGKYAEKLSDLLLGDEETDNDEIKELLNKYENSNKTLDENIFKEFKYIRHLLSDKFTDIHLLKRMRDSGGGQAIISAEAKSFVNYITKRCKDVSIFNKSYDLESIDYGSERNFIHVDDSFLTILLFGQPKIITDFFNDEDVIGTGLGSRFMTIMIDKNENSLANINHDDSSISKFKNIIKEMIQENIKVSMNGEFHDLILDGNSSEIFGLFREDVNGWEKEDHTNIILQTSKRTPGLALRIAANLQALNKSARFKTKLEERYMLSGTEMSKYAIECKNFITNPRSMPAIEDAKLIVKWAFEHNCPTFDSRQLQQRSPVRNKDRIVAALDLLESKNYIAQIKTGIYPRKCGLNPRLTQGNFSF